MASVAPTKQCSRRGRMVAWRTVCNVYTVLAITCVLSQHVLSQGSVNGAGSQRLNNRGRPYVGWQEDDYESSGSDGLGFGKDDDEILMPAGSGGGPVILSSLPPVPPGAGRPSQGGNDRGGLGGGGSSGGNKNDAMDAWRNSGFSTPSSGGKGNFPPGRPYEDDDDLFESSGDIIMEPDRKQNVPNLGGEVNVDRPTQFPPHVPFPTSRPRPGDPQGPGVRSSPPGRPSDSWQPTTTRDLIVRPDVDWNQEKNSPDGHNYKGTSAFFRIFNDPLVLAGIISGAVLALLCIVLIVMYMIYRMRKKDEGSYALGEPKRTYDIRYTRTKDQEFFA